MYYIIYNTATQTYVEDENFKENRPPKLYPTIDAAVRKLIEIERWMNRLENEGRLQHYVPHHYRKFDINEWEIQEVVLRMNAIVDPSTYPRWVHRR